MTAFTPPRAGVEGPRVRRRRRTSRRRRQLFWRTVRRLVLLAVLLIVVAAIVALVPAVSAGLDARGQLSELQTKAAALRQAPSAALLDAVEQDDARLLADIQTLQSSWAFWQRPALFVSGIDPSIHGQLLQVAPLLRYGALVGRAAHTLGGPLQPLLARGAHATTASAPALVADLAAARPALRQARSLLLAARQARGAVTVDGLPSQIVSGLALLDGVVPSAPQTLAALDALPTALGADGPRDYLIVPQNTADLRASGGFVGTVAVLHVDHGRVHLTAAESSYDVDKSGRPNVDPPLPLSVHELSAWFFRDVNWSADFPTTAALLEVFYQLGTGKHVDGVIAFNSSLLRQIVQVTGPVAVPGYSGATLTPDNAYDELNYRVNGVDPTQGGKAFAVAAYGAVFERLLALPSLGGKPALDLVRAGVVGSRDIQLYSDDDAVEKAIVVGGADGAIAPTAQDYLYVVDTNTTANKINPLVKQSLSYNAVIGAKRDIVATVTISYTNTADKANTPVYNGRPTYADFVRVFVPAGSTLINTGTTGLDELWPTYTVHRKAQFSGWFRLASHASRTITLRYRVPANSAAGAQYHLLVQHQSGAPAAELRIDVSAAPGVSLGDDQTGPTVHLATTLEPDVVVQRTLSGGEPAPIPIDYGVTEPVIPGSQPEQWVTVPTGRLAVETPVTP